MSRPKRVDDDALLDVARACFLEQGAAAPASMIAERAGLTTPVLFQRFGSKEKLLAKAMAPRPEDLPMVLEQGCPTGQRPLREQLIELFEDVARFFETMLPAASVLRFSRCAGFGGETGPARSLRLMSRWLEHAVELGLLAAHDSRALALHLLGALQVGPLLQHLEPEGPRLLGRQQTAQSLAELVINAYGKEVEHG